ATLLAWRSGVMGYSSSSLRVPVYWGAMVRPVEVDHGRSETALYKALGGLHYLSARVVINDRGGIMFMNQVALTFLPIVLAVCVLSKGTILRLHEPRRLPWCPYLKSSVSSCVVSCWA